MSAIFELFTPGCSICEQPADYGAAEDDGWLRYYCDRHKPGKAMGVLASTSVGVLFGNGYWHARSVDHDVIFRAFHNAECSEGWGANMLGVGRAVFRGMYQDWLKEFEEN